MKVNTIYPVTTADKVTKVSDPTNGGNKASLAEVLANMAAKYASLDKTGIGARASETWHQQDNHISFGGLQGSVDYSDKTALDLLKAVLSPEYYPYKESKFSLGKLGNDVFVWYNATTHREDYTGGTFPNLYLSNTVSVWSYPSDGGYNATSVAKYILKEYTWRRLQPSEDFDAYRIKYYVDPKAEIILNPDNLYTSLGTQTSYISESKNSLSYNLTVNDLKEKEFSTVYYNVTVKKPLVVYKDENGNYVPCWWINNDPTQKKVECKAIAKQQPVFYVLKDAASEANYSVTFCSKNELGGKIYWVPTSTPIVDYTPLSLKMDGNYMVEGDGSGALEYLKFTTKAPGDDPFWTEDVIIQATINI